jgi:hypothetical protein
MRLSRKSPTYSTGPEFIISCEYRNRTELLKSSEDMNFRQPDFSLPTSPELETRANPSPNSINSSRKSVHHSVRENQRTQRNVRSWVAETEDDFTKCFIHSNSPPTGSAYGMPPGTPGTSTRRISTRHILSPYRAQSLRPCDSDIHTATTRAAKRHAEFKMRSETQRFPTAPAARRSMNRQQPTFPSREMPLLIKRHLRKPAESAAQKNARSRRHSMHMTKKMMIQETITTAPVFDWGLLCA